MEVDNIYTTYKRDTKYLLYWLISVSNSIIASLKDGSATIKRNTTGEVTVAGILSMAQLIARHILPSEVPRLVSYLFRTVLRARTATYEAFKRMETRQAKPDPELQKSNARHKHFNDKLAEAFKALGCSENPSKHKNGADATQQPGQDELDELVQFANKFSALNIDDAADSHHGTDSDSNVEDSDRRAFNKQPKKGKGKKGKGKGKTRRSQKNIKQHEQAASAQPLGQVPFHSYRIIEDGDGLGTDYLMAVHALTHEWVNLREYVQHTWYEVAYEGLNSAVAAAVSNIAISMIKRSEFALAIDFPGHDDYPTIMKTLTRGKASEDGALVGDFGSKSVDIKEQFLIHAYNDLAEFIGDYQKNRNCKPTKRMAAQIQDWGLDYDLQQATDEERVKWRRKYTINWLYDLVNIFAAPVIFDNTANGGNHAYEEMDWSTAGHCDGRVRVLYGLDDLAAVITSFAMQKPDTDVRRQIMASHVFQLQCIVDAFTASRGWSPSCLHNHVLRSPVNSFYTRRDVQLFLHKEDNRAARGWLQSVRVLRAMIEADGHRSSGLTALVGHFEDFGQNFMRWLGDTTSMWEARLAKPTRFSLSAGNGLWDFSPYACGAGLMEVLDFTYSVALVLMEKIPEPVLLAHLHNMLVQKGYLKEPIPLWNDLSTKLFPQAFFANGKLPTSRFFEAFESHFRAVTSRRNVSQFRSARREALSSHSANSNFQSLFDPIANLLFKRESVLTALRRAGWSCDHIPDDAVAIGSMMSLLRISRTGHTVDPTTGEPRMQDTPLVARARKAGLTEGYMLAMSNASRQKFGPVADDDNNPDAAHTEQDDDVSDSATRRSHAPALSDRFRLLSPEAQKLDYPARVVLDMMKEDLHHDIAGNMPLSGLNLLGILVLSISMFDRIETRLEKMRNPSYVLFYETRKDDASLQKRSFLTTTMLAGQDEECLRVMAEAFKGISSVTGSHLYWDPTMFRMGDDYGMRGYEEDADDAEERRDGENGGDDTKVSGSDHSAI
ncbi:hypothetical protein PG995_014438 [Apiospora arundinis]